MPIHFFVINIDQQLEQVHNNTHGANHGLNPERKDTRYRDSTLALSLHFVLYVDTILEATKMQTLALGRRY